MHSPEAFNAKLEAYGFDDYLVHYLYSYLDNRKQWVRINNERSSLQNIISAVPQGSIVGPTLFKLFFEVAIKWFHENKIIVNPDKFQAL